ncbi:MAG: anaerobic ribonucleoside triphosphate reductase [Clostridiaceae bacterium]
MECIMEVMKRDGRKVPFDQEKIVTAIKKAFKATETTIGENAISDMLMDVNQTLMERDQNASTVENIQDVVEETLQKHGYYKVSKSYILYRNHRTNNRELNSNLMKIYEKITFSESGDEDIKRENANVNGDTAMGTMLKYGSEGSKSFSELFVLDPVHAKAHREGDIHIHDLDFYNLTTTCTQIDLISLFKGGFSTGHGFLREPQDILSYSALACIAIQSNQNDQHGGQSIPNFDYAMAMGVKKTYVKNFNRNLNKIMDILSDEDNESIVKNITQALQSKGLDLRIDNSDSYLVALSEELLSHNFTQTDIEKILKFTLREALKETNRNTYQAMEALIHNLNTMNSRAGAQVPFSSLNYGTDTSPEGRMVVKNLLLSLENGLGIGETPIFPIHIFRIKDGINLNPGEPNYDLFELAAKVSAKRLFPNFSFQDAPFNLQYYKEGHPETEISYMGCRTRVMSNIIDSERETSYGRGNLSFTSINLPRLAILAQGNLSDFYKRLDDMLTLSVDQLLNRFEIQISKKVKNSPFLMGQGVWMDSEKLSSNDTLENVLKHGTLSVGFIGLAETLTALTGFHHGESEISRALGIEIISHMRKKMDEETLKRNLNFSLIATPAEGLSGRFVKLDQKKFGTIKGVTDRDYYTNSFHVPVYFPISAYKKIDIEAPYHELTNAGHITYVELDGDATNNPKAFMKIIKHMQKSGIGYGSINHPVDWDPVCAYGGIINDTCPKCGRDESLMPFVRIRRITGYLVGSLDRFNNAKLSEVRDRLQHKMGNGNEN